MEYLASWVNGFLDGVGFLENRYLTIMYSLLLNLFTPIRSITNIEIKVKPNQISVSYDNSSPITYQKVNNGSLKTTVTWYRTSRIFIDSQDFFSVFCMDFEAILKENDFNLDYFRFIFHYDMENRTEEFFEEFKKVLKMKNQKMPVKFLHLEVFGQEDILAILPFFEPDTIFIIDALRRFKLLEMEEIMKLEQFKKAKELEIWRFYVHGEYRDFVHFKKCIVDFQPRK